jgi:hypothetical protein
MTSALQPILAVMQPIFEIASRVSTPLGLAGLFAAIIFFLIRQIISKNIFPELTKALSGDIIKLIIERLFVLSLIAMVLGFVGFVITPRDQNPPPPTTGNPGNVDGTGSDSAGAASVLPVVRPHAAFVGMGETFKKYRLWITTDPESAISEIHSVIYEHDEFAGGEKSAIRMPNDFFEVFYEGGVLSDAVTAKINWDKRPREVISFKMRAVGDFKD